MAFPKNREPLGQAVGHGWADGYIHTYMDTYMAKEIPDPLPF